MWDLAPTGGNQCSGVKQNFTDAQALFLTDAPDRIGPSPSKARYVEYTDATFTTPRVRPSAAPACGGFNLPFSLSHAMTCSAAISALRLYRDSPITENIAHILSGSTFEALPLLS